MYAIFGVTWLGKKHDVAQKQICYKKKIACVCVWGGGGGVCCLKSWNEDYEPVGENKWERGGGGYNMRYQIKQICICRKIIMKKQFYRPFSVNFISSNTSPND